MNNWPEVDLRTIAQFVNRQQFQRAAAGYDAAVGAAILGFSFIGIMRGGFITCLSPALVGLFVCVSGLFQVRRFSPFLTVAEAVLLFATGVVSGTIPAVWWFVNRVQSHWLPEAIGLALILLGGAFFELVRLVTGTQG